MSTSITAVYPLALTQLGALGEGALEPLSRAALEAEARAARQALLAAVYDQAADRHRTLESALAYLQYYMRGTQVPAVPAGQVAAAQTAYEHLAWAMARVLDRG